MIAVVAVVAGDADVAAENRGVVHQVALGELRLGAGESAEDPDTVLERERGRAVGAGGRLVGALGYPDLIAGLGRAEGGLQIGEGVRPGRAVICARGGCVHVPDGAGQRAVFEYFQPQPGAGGGGAGSCGELPAMPGLPKGHGLPPFIQAARVPRRKFPISLKSTGGPALVPKPTCRSRRGKVVGARWGRGDCKAGASRRLCCKGALSNGPGSDGRGIVIARPSEVNRNSSNSCTKPRNGHE